MRPRWRSEADLLKVGLTGGMASGKTTVGEMLQARGAHLLQADKLAQELMQPGLPVYDAVVGHFGPEIVKSDGTIHRAKLAGIVFPDRIEELNKLVHPAVIQRQEEWMNEIGAREPHAVTIVEAALIVEAGTGRQFQKLIMVTCSMEQKIERFARRLGVSAADARAEVERRMAAQVSDEIKVKNADFVIDNSGTIEQLGPQVDKVWAELKRLAARG
ncbi:MAG TPA: dephospho-CoA kinase [Terriglobales bacterium]|nr:dephospho-CoA kinase [Terriglobales bacterium]